MSFDKYGRQKPMDAYGNQNNGSGHDTDAWFDSECNDCIDNCLSQYAHCDGCHSYHPGGGCQCFQHCAIEQDMGYNCNDMCIQNGGTFDECCGETTNCAQWEYCCSAPGTANCMDQCMGYCTMQGNYGGYSGERGAGTGRDNRKGGKIRRRRRR